VGMTPKYVDPLHWYCGPLTRLSSLRALRGISLEASRACEDIAVVAEDGSVLLQVLNWKDREHKFDVSDLDATFQLYLY
jgi:hypothetical protein